MDLHPIVVHFPIALLTLYTASEVFRRFTKAAHWGPLCGILVVTGTIGAFVGLSTGETAEHLFRDSAFRNVLELHSLFASITTWIYAIPAGAYVIRWLNARPQLQSLSGGIKKLLAFLADIASIILETPIAPVLAILGFLGLSLVGALGATLVYGPDFDPITSFVYQIFFGGGQ